MKSVANSIANSIAYVLASKWTSTAPQVVLNEA
jgi:hypothetical protein